MDSIIEVPVSNHVEYSSSSGTLNAKTKRVYVCYICNKSFSQNLNLKQHIKIHSGEKLFKCEVCLITFQRKSNLMRRVTIRKCPFTVRIVEHFFHWRITYDII